MLRDCMNIHHAYMKALCAYYLPVVSIHTAGPQMKMSMDAALPHLEMSEA